VTWGRVSGAIVALALLASVLGAADRAHAAVVTLGQTGGTQSCAPDTTFLQDATAPGGPSYEVPSAGRITQWRYEAGLMDPQQLQLKVFRRTFSPTRFFTVAQSGIRHMAPGELNTFEASPPLEVRAGDVIGLYVHSISSATTCRASTGSTADRYLQHAGETSLGTGADFTAATGSTLNLSVTLETSGGAGPALLLGGRKKQRSARAVKVEATCEDQACTVNAEGTVKSPKHRRSASAAARSSLKPDSAQLAASQTATLKLKLAKKARKRVKRAGKGRASVTVTATNSAGESSQQTRAVKLKK
jgi:hypothetical protein